MGMSVNPEASSRPEAKILCVSAEPDPRIEELLDSASFGIDACKVGALMDVTMKTGESKVLNFVTAAMLPGNDMLYLKTQPRLVNLPKAAVFTSASGPLDNEAAYRR